MRWYIIQTHYPRLENVHSMPAEHGMPTSIIGWCRKSVLGYTSTPDVRILDLLEKHVLGDRRCCRHRLNLCSKRYSTIGRHDEMIVERKTKLYTRKICARGSARRRTHHVKFVSFLVYRTLCMQHIKSLARAACGILNLLSPSISARSHSTHTQDIYHEGNKNNILCS